MTFFDEYPAKAHRVLDGDTYELDVDLGFGVTSTITVRLAGIDCPELSTPAGVEARLFALRWFQDRGWPNGKIKIKPQRNSHDEYVRTFVRYVADVTDLSGAFNLADDLRAAGHEKIKSTERS